MPIKNNGSSSSSLTTKFKYPHIGVWVHPKLAVNLSVKTELTSSQELVHVMPPKTECYSTPIIIIIIIIIIIFISNV
jgi:hypothetical protein